MMCVRVVFSCGMCVCHWAGREGSETDVFILNLQQRDFHVESLSET